MCGQLRPVEVFQESDGVVSGGKNPGLGLGGVLAQADRPAVAESPVLMDQLVQQVRGCAGDFFQRGADRLGDHLQAGHCRGCRSRPAWSLVVCLLGGQGACGWGLLVSGVEECS